MLCIREFWKRKKQKKQKPYHHVKLKSVMMNAHGTEAELSKRGCEHRVCWGTSQALRKEEEVGQDFTSIHIR